MTQTPRASPDHLARGSRVRAHLGDERVHDECAVSGQVEEGVGLGWRAAGAATTEPGEAITV